MTSIKIHVSFESIQFNSCRAAELGYLIRAGIQPLPLAMFELTASAVAVGALTTTFFLLAMLLRALRSGQAVSDLWTEASLPILSFSTVAHGFLGRSKHRGLLYWDALRRTGSMLAMSTGVLAPLSPVLNVCDEELIREILRNEENSFEKAVFPSSFAGHDFGGLLENPSVTSAEGSVWSRHRHATTKVLGGNNAARFVPNFALNSEWALTCLGNPEVDIRDTLEEMALRTVCSCVLGVDDPARVSEALKAYRVLIRNLEPSRMMMNAWSSVVTDLSSSPECKEAVSTFASFVESSSLFEGEDFTSGERLGNAFVFFMAGHDRMASALCTAITLLSNNSSVQAELRREVQSSFPNGLVDAEGLKQLKLLDRFIREALRFLGPIPHVTRVAVRDTIVAGRYLVKQGVRVRLSLHGVHMTQWADPEEFRPERFETMPQKGWMPFSLGPRMCPAIKYSLCQEKVFLSELLLRYEVCSTGAAPTVPHGLSAALQTKVTFIPL